eukprot:768810-Hanusia_phi.AAC.18
MKQPLQLKAERRAGVAIQLIREEVVKGRMLNEKLRERKSDDKGHCWFHIKRKGRCRIRVLIVALLKHRDRASWARRGRKRQRGLMSKDNLNRDEMLEFFFAFSMGRHQRLGEDSKMKLLSDDIMKEILKFFTLGWDANYASWNMIFNKDKSIVDINGGHRERIIGRFPNTAGRGSRMFSLITQVSVQDMRTLCVGVTEMPKNPRSLSDKWLGEIGYGISSRYSVSLEQRAAVDVDSNFIGAAHFPHPLMQLKGFTQKQTVGLLLDMDKYDRTLDLYVDGARVGSAFTRLPPGPLYPACSNGFDKAFCRGSEDDS